MPMKKIFKMATIYGVVTIALLLCTKLGSRAVTTLSENKVPEREHCIVIDPGHGGEDGGAISCSGFPESSYNLQISQKLNDLLNLLGYQTKMIRTTDISVYTKGETLVQKKSSDLNERVNLINDTHGAILLSIHQNHFPDSRYSGAQVFYSKTDGSPQLAAQLQKAFVSTLNPGSHRQEKKSSGIYLMEHIQCPGVLIECGFLSNPEEDAKLRDPVYQNNLCSVISTTVCQYLSNT